MGCVRLNVKAETRGVTAELSCPRRHHPQICLVPRPAIRHAQQNESSPPMSNPGSRAIQPCLCLARPSLCGEQPYSACPVMLCAEGSFAKISGR